MKYEIQSVETAAISYDDVSKVVSVQSLSVGKLMGPLDAAAQTISNPVISGGRLSLIGTFYFIFNAHIRNCMYVIHVCMYVCMYVCGICLESVSTGSLEVTALRSSAAGNRLAFLDQRGRFVAQADPQVPRPPPLE